VLHPLRSTVAQGEIQNATLTSRVLGAW
jgi:hypothetical protein